MRRDSVRWPALNHQLMIVGTTVPRKCPCSTASSACAATFSTEGPIVDTVSMLDVGMKCGKQSCRERTEASATGHRSRPNARRATKRK